MNELTIIENNSDISKKSIHNKSNTSNTLYLVINTSIYTDINGVFDSYDKAYECILAMGASDDMIIYKMALNEYIYDFYLADLKRVTNHFPQILLSRRR
jgi:hypothetical protein